MNAPRRAARAEQVNGTDALDSSPDATITWLTSVGYDGPRNPVPGPAERPRIAPAPSPVPPPPALPPERLDRAERSGREIAVTPSGGLRLHGDDGVEDPWAPVAVRRTMWARNWGAVVAFALVCAVLTLMASSFVSPNYSASSVVRVTTGVGALSSRDSVTASNDLAAQFSQLIETAEVKNAAATKAGVSPDVVQGHVSASVLSNQNLIQITAKAGTAKEASAIAAAAASVLTKMAEASLQDTVTPVVAAQLKQLDKAVEDSQKDLRKMQSEAGGAEPGSSRAVALQAEINGVIQKISQLQYRQLQLQQDNVIDNAQRQVLLNDLGPSGPAHKDSPRPFLYALIAFALAVVVGAQVAVTVSGRRNRVG